jgi:hypothetical protein
VGTAAKVGAQVHDSLQRFADSVDKAVDHVTDSVGKGGLHPVSGEAERPRGRDALGGSTARIIRASAI